MRNTKGEKPGQKGCFHEYTHQNMRVSRMVTGTGPAYTQKSTVNPKASLWKDGGTEGANFVKSKAGACNLAVHEKVTWLAGIRDKLAQSEGCEFKKMDAEEMVKGMWRFLEEYRPRIILRD
jgi:hypothetical protein